MRGASIAGALAIGRSQFEQWFGEQHGVAANIRREPKAVVALAVLIAYPLIQGVLPAELPLPDLNGAIVMLYYAALALGLNIVVGFAGLLDLGYVAFFAIGAYVTAFLASPHFDIHLSWLVVVWIAVGAAALSGAALGAPTLRLRGDYLAIVTLGFGEMIPLVVRNLGDVTLGFGDGVLVGPRANLTGGNLGINPIDPLILPNPFGGSAIAFDNNNLVASFYLILLLLGVAYFVSTRLRDSRLGRAWLAIREDEVAATATGVNTVSTKILAFAIGASFSGFVGAFVGAYQTAIFPESFKFSISITILVMVILGGMGNSRGVIVGAFVIQYLSLTGLPWLGRFVNEPVQSLGRTLDVRFLQDFVLHGFNFLIFGLILVGMMLVRPEGLMPARPRTNPRRASPGGRLAGGHLGQSRPTASPPGHKTPKSAGTPGRSVAQRGTPRPLFSARGVTKAFGNLVAVNDVTFDVVEGSIASVIGPNGAGKTTLFDMMTGLLRPSSGQFLLDGVDVTATPGHEIVRAGIARTFQNIRLFGSLTVEENVLVGLHHRLRTRWWSAILGRRAARDEESAAVTRARGILELVGLPGVGSELARNLSYGDQRRLEIARALASSPRLLLLDEPTAGMNPEETRVMTELIRGLQRDLGLTIVLIEHDMRVVMEISDRITVLDHGEKIAEGTPEEIRTNPRVIEAYLGRSGVRAAPATSRRPAGDVLLEVRDVQTRYGSIIALHEISLVVREAEIVALLGANGAGKTTALKTISGLIQPARGDIFYAGERITKLPPHEIVSRGISQCLEGRRVFARMTVRENLEMGAYPMPDGRRSGDDMERVSELFPRLRERMAQAAGTLSGGEQQMLAIGRALMARPRLLLLDEPSMGLAPLLVEQIFTVIRDINATGTTILLVEQNASAALGIADRAYVLQTGSISAADSAARLAVNPDVQKAFLGA